ncbi:MAG: hypothetical protein AAF609_09355 [Cyanobacteria bacterium P01_C01_bin.120]
MPIQNRLRFGTIALIGLEISLAGAYCLTVWRHGATVAWLDFNGLRSLPSLMQAVHLFALGAICLLLLVRRRQMPRPCSWYLPLALACLCFFGGLDELIKLHLTVDQINWKALYLGLLAAIPIVSWRDLRWLWQTHRPTLLWIAGGMGIFLLGGFGAEMLQGAIATAMSTSADPQAKLLAEHLRIAVEEFAELLGETLILYAFLDFTTKVLASSQRQKPQGYRASYKG